MPEAQEVAVCDSQDAIRLATAWATALRPETDPQQLAADLDRAAAEAPELLRSDFRIVVDAQAPFFAAIGRAKASDNLAALTQDADFQRGIAALSRPDVTTSIGRINRWYASHCQPRR